MSLARVREMYDEKWSTLKEAQSLLDASWHCSNEELASSIQSWIRELLQPLANGGVAEALYIIGSIDSGEVLDEEEYDQRYMARL